MGFGGLPVCMAKTQYSLSDDPDPFRAVRRASLIHVSEVRLSAGAGFVVVQTGDIMTMPGAAQGSGRRADRCGRGRSDPGSRSDFSQIKRSVTNLQKFISSSPAETATDRRGCLQRPSGGGEVLAFRGGLGMGETCFTTGTCRRSGHRPHRSIQSHLCPGQ